MPLALWLGWHRHVPPRPSKLATQRVIVEQSVNISASADELLYKPDGDIRTSAGCVHCTCGLRRAGVCGMDWFERRMGEVRWSGG